MSLVKHNNNSISELTTAGQLAQGKMTLISSQTASGSASISFTSGIDSTYPIYKFEFINCHPSTDQTQFSFQGSINGGTSYGVTITSTHFSAYHREDDATASVSYVTSTDLAQSTNFQRTSFSIGNDNDHSVSGEMYLFNPSSTIFVKHFLVNVNSSAHDDQTVNGFTGGYFNDGTNDIDAIKFQMVSGNIDSGTIKLYGIGD